ncbi:hypothetical protein NEISICOT_00573 [Neisseria sicca ATCC 29256]|uniref:PilS cassette n=1 Tax=Neisseria sicca ATCC 29256 TaxID=547045 RepID=C6M235_NEISI|nr:hypothetical protein NEISICOT_00573 [Neisseria sicca ATCC 29256]
MSTYADSSPRQTVSDKFEPVHQPSFPRRRESIDKTQFIRFKQRLPKFRNGLPPARE